MRKGELFSLQNRSRTIELVRMLSLRRKRVKRQCTFPNQSGRQNVSSWENSDWIRGKEERGRNGLCSPSLPVFSSPFFFSLNDLSCDGRHCTWGIELFVWTEKRIGSGRTKCTYTTHGMVDGQDGRNGYESGIANGLIGVVIQSRRKEEDVTM